ncbi:MULTISPECIES: N-acetylmuramate alpha-1-phosphate uridylyltransferase MurU [Thioalkalivibrio]|uniref:N-acetylmuramate alpha-1-phosphate uridylyltransferase MurU n=1 Tax=Thioalkalivibrio TaxID=106633 RepID=UPI00037A5396|nr:MULTISPECIES: nucleotidyltransferase family protein [Thioalkalivibrio]
MRAMILAAGRGERMRPLTDHCPKPLLPVAGRPLIAYTLERLARAGYRTVVINTAHLGEQIRETLGRKYAGMRLLYSEEPEGALETAGGIRQALPLLGDEPFLVVNGDVWCEHPLHPPAKRLLTESGRLAHLVLVDNPAHHPQGDFRLSDGRVSLGQGTPLTFSGIGWYHPALFADLPEGRRPLGPLLREVIDGGRVSGEHYQGDWRDIGTPERLAALEVDIDQRRDHGLM